MNILLICPLFNGFYKSIIQQLEKNGNNVYFFAESLETTFLDRICAKISQKRNYDRYQKKLANYCHSINDVKIDKVILIFGGKLFSKECLDVLKNCFNKADYIYYAWDSMKNYPNILNFYNKFDKFYSFDSFDCNEYGFTFLPLFYSYERYECELKFDYCSLMGFSYKKASNYKMIKSCLPKNLNGCEYLVMKYKSTFVSSKIIHSKEFKGFSIKDIKFKSLSPNEAQKLLNSSKVVIDCPLLGQNGLTIRTFDALHLRKKIITTNENIKKYDFYTPKNIFVVENYNSIIPESFFEEEFDTKYDISDNYSIESFVKKLLS